MFGAGELNYFDTTGDGIFDTMVHTTGGFDFNETTMIFSDTTGDGIFDIVETFTDTTGSGFYDTHTIVQDTTGDGSFDFFAKNIDTTGNGEIDTIVFSTERDGIFETIEIFQDSGYGFELVDVITLDYIDTTDWTVLPVNTGLSNFDPNDPSINHDAIIGNPGADMEVWVFQEVDGPCALYTQMFAIEGLTGQTIDMAEFQLVAEAHGWYNDGTPHAYVAKMLDYYGITNEMSYGNDLSDIVNTLSNDGKVIAMVNADKIWYDYDSEIYAPGSSNHAVQVIGIDNSDPDNPMIILNDPGVPDGSGLMVPANQFMDSWGDGDFQMVAAY
jgi:hypothetical protein